MHEVYTCICGGQDFVIMTGARIYCRKCGKEYQIKYIESGPGVERIEDPDEFNERIRQEVHGGLVAEPAPPFTKKLIDDKEG